mgnify:CR=1 FL=1
MRGYNSVLEQLKQLTKGRKMQLGKYELIEQLGQGGFGIVYKAEDLTLGRMVALKVLHPQLTIDPRFIENFKHEARHMAKVSHANVVSIYEIGEVEGRIFIAMQYLPGGNLEQKIKNNGPIPFPKALEVARQIAKGLEAGHRKNMIHRDVKPANILFDEDGDALIGDFGVAHTVQLSSMGTMSQTGVGVGTLNYRPPELWNGTPPPSQATDQYSLACVFYEMLSGKQLFDGDTTEQVLVKHLIREPEFGELEPEGLKGILSRAVAKKAEERFGSLSELIETLTHLSDPPSPQPEPIKLDPEENESVGQSIDTSLTLNVSEEDHQLLPQTENLDDIEDAQKLVDSKDQNLMVEEVRVEHISLGQDDEFDEKEVHIWKIGGDFLSTADISDSIVETQSSDTSNDNSMIIWFLVLVIILSIFTIIYLPAVRGYYGDGAITLLIFCLLLIPIVLAISRQQNNKPSLVGSSPNIYQVDSPRTVAFEPSGTRLAIGERNGQIDIIEQQDCLIISGHTGSVNLLVFSREGSYLLSGSSDKTIRKWSLRGEVITNEVVNLEDAPTCLAISPDDGYYVCGCKDGRVVLLDLQVNKVLMDFVGHAGSITGVSIIADGQQLVTSSEDGTVKVWDVSTGSLTTTLVTLSSPIIDVVFSPDSAFFAVVSKDGVITIYETESYSLVQSIAAGIVYNNNLKFSPDNKFLAFASFDKIITIYQVDNWKELKQLSGHSFHINTIDFSPDGRKLASSSFDGTVRIWDISSLYQLER